MQSQEEASDHDWRGRVAERYYQYDRELCERISIIRDERDLRIGAYLRLAKRTKVCKNSKGLYVRRQSSPILSVGTFTAINNPREGILVVDQNRNVRGFAAIVLASRSVKT